MIQKIGGQDEGGPLFPPPLMVDGTYTRLT